MWWQPWTWVEEALVLTFKLIAKKLEPLSFTGKLKTRLEQDLKENAHEFVDMRALHGVSRKLRENLTAEMKKMIDDEAEKEIRRSLKDVPYM